MCVAMVGKIIEISNTRAICSLNGVLKEISLALLPIAKVGDDVLIHSGFASEIIKDKKRLYKDIISSDSLSRQILDAIERENNKLKNREIKIVNFSYLQESSIVKYSLEEFLPDNIKLVGGFSCPACTIPENELELGLKIAMKNNVIVAIPEDLLNIPTSLGTFSKLKEENKNIEVVNSATDALELAKITKKELVYFAVGFETSMLEIADVILKAKKVDNFSIISSSRRIIPMIKGYLEKNSVDGVLCSGYIPEIIGMQSFDKLSKKTKINCVVAGLEPVDIFRAVLEILVSLNSSSINTINIYNPIASLKKDSFSFEKIEKVFTLHDSFYRSLAQYKNSKFVLKREFNHFNAEKKFEVELIENSKIDLKNFTCDVLFNGSSSKKCPNYCNVCTPQTPQNSYMASTRGVCNILYQYEVL